MIEYKKKYAVLSSRYKQDNINLRVIDSTLSWRKYISNFKKTIQNTDYEQINCPCCDSTDKIKLSEKDAFGFDHNVVLCSNCGLTYVSPRYNEKFTKNFYENHYFKIYKFNSINEFDRFEQGKKSESFAYNKSKDLSLKINSVLDVGCGSGIFLYPFFKDGIKTLGIDFSESRFLPGIKHGLNLKKINLENITEKFDLILLNHVLEHTLDISKFLSLIKSKLSVYGHVFIEVPSFGMMRNKSVSFDFLRTLQNAHNYYFSKGSLVNIMQKNGFEKVYINDQIQSLWKISNQKQLREFKIKNVCMEDFKRYKRYEFKFFLYGEKDRQGSLRFIVRKFFVDMLKKLHLYNTIKKIIDN